MDKLLIYILPIISTLVVVIALVYDGKLVAENEKAIFKRIKPAGYLLILFTLLLNLYQSISSDYTLTESKAQARNKEIKDSIRIAELTQLAKTNLVKTDSVKIQLIDNAVKVIDEQRLAIERERENTFMHFQNEVKENLRKILVNYDDKEIIGFADTTLFIGTRLNNTYIEKYQLVSTNKFIIEYLMQTSERIVKTNNYANLLTEGRKEGRKLNIRMFIANKEVVYNYLISIYARIEKLNSYKEYDSLNFEIPAPEINREELHSILLYQEILRTNDRKTIVEFNKSHNIK